MQRNTTVGRNKPFSWGTGRSNTRVDGISIVAHGGRGKWCRIVGQCKTKAARGEEREKVRGEGRGGGSGSVVPSLPLSRMIKDTLFGNECVNAD